MPKVIDRFREDAYHYHQGGWRGFPDLRTTEEYKERKTNFNKSMEISLISKHIPLILREAKEIMVDKWSKIGTAVDLDLIGWELSFNIISKIIMGKDFKNDALVSVRKDGKVENWKIQDLLG